MTRPLLLALLFTFPSTLFALEPKDIFIIANKNVPASKEVAEHYAAKRGVPVEQIVYLDLPAGEDISRAEYDAKLAGPLRDVLKDKKAAAKVLLTVYGVPLRVGRQLPTAEEKAAADKLKPDVDAAKKKFDELTKDKAAAPADVAEARKQKEALESRNAELTRPESHACVDSELMCLWWPKYPLNRWVMNPHNFRASDNFRAARRPRQ